MLINREKETNGKAVTYLDRLQENYHDLFSKPLQKAEFTETDIKLIETEWGYELPKPYIDFLQSYQLPKCFMVSVSFCGLSAQRTFIMKIVWNLYWRYRNERGKED